MTLRNGGERGGDGGKERTGSEWKKNKRGVPKNKKIKRDSQREHLEKSTRHYRDIFVSIGMF